MAKLDFKADAKITVYFANISISEMPEQVAFECNILFRYINTNSNVPKKNQSLSVVSVMSDVS